jgi:hypothetical protein
MNKKEFFESDFWIDFGRPFCIWACMVGGIAAIVGLSYLLFE